jgi:hypothetical protein
MIHETIVTTVDLQGEVHIAPIGVIEERTRWIIAPFRPSKTLDNLSVVPFAIANCTDDVRVFAGCLTGRKDWPTVSCEGNPAPRLAKCLAHVSLRVVEVAEDELRPRFSCELLAHVAHAPFAGFNRAQAAVIEAAILVSRLHILSRERIEREIAALDVAIAKTAGANERIAWGWLMEKIAAHYATGERGA